MKKYSIAEIDHMEGHEFEYFCAELLQQKGYVDIEVTPGSGDQGIDILAVKDGITFGIQCKCYSSDIGNKAVQEAYSGKEFYGCHIGSVLSNSYFTASAKELAKRNRILLWDRDYLIDLLKSADLYSEENENNESSVYENNHENIITLESDTLPPPQQQEVTTHDPEKLYDVVILSANNKVFNNKSILLMYINKLSELAEMPSAEIVSKLSKIPAEIVTNVSRSKAERIVHTFCFDLGTLFIKESHKPELFTDIR